MGIKVAEYKEIRSNMLPGDIIVFSGKGHFSEVIKWATTPEVAHVGIVFETKVLFAGTVQDGCVVNVMESTTMCVDPESDKRIAGVQRNRMSKRIEYYNGTIWWLPPNADSRRKLNEKKHEFMNVLLHSIDKPSDMPQAIRSAIDAMDGIALINTSTYNDEDYAAFFCSELASAALEGGGVINAINASEVTPVDLCRFSPTTISRSNL